MLIVTHAVVHARPGETERGELCVDGSVIVEPGAPDKPVGRDKDATVIDAGGASVVPLFVDTVFDCDSPPPAGSFDLGPGNPATFAVISRPVSASSIRDALVVKPEDLVAVVVAGRIIVRDGQPQLPAGTGLVQDDPRLGPWRDPRRGMTQYLTPEGRYSETRSGRPDAFTGSFWLDANRITYLDDTGFWAFGQFHEGVLYHAGFVLRPTI